MYLLLQDQLLFPYLCWYFAALGVENEVGEVLLLGFDGEVVVSDAVPLVVEEADEDNDETE